LIPKMNPLMYRQHRFPIIPYAIPGVLPHRREVNDEEDLATVALQIQKKRFYVDVKKNWRGRFMKIAESQVGMDGRKARILLTMSAADDLKDKLKDLTEVYEEIAKKEAENQGDSADHGDKSSDNEDGLIKSHIVNYPHRRYYLDLKKNRRGYFLRLTMISTTARIKLAVPAQGMRDLYNSICDLLKAWWNQAPSSAEQKALNLPGPKAFRIDNRMLYFDSVSNRYGVFLRISQVWASSRSAITIPERSLNRFRDIINELAEGISSSSIKEEEDSGVTEKDVERSADESIPRTPTSDLPAD
uniref:Transcriptional activator protein Pur-alpha n=1 Tax=Schistocephalus solidus TaxID=70667 RepID=A0A183T524_SCHSO